MGCGEWEFKSPRPHRNSRYANSQLLNVHSPKPTLSSLMLKLIARVRALR
jgi:hypothetical protein